MTPDLAGLPVVVTGSTRGLGRAFAAALAAAGARVVVNGTDPGTTAAVADALRAAGGTGGAVLHVTSGSGLFGTAGQTNYSAAKAGVVGLTRAMDLELHHRGIRVNALAPVARTDLTAVFETGAVGHALAFPPPETVAPVVVFLASRAAGHLHGQVLSFDGTQLSVWTHPAPAATWERAAWTPDAFAAALTDDVQQPRNPDRWGAGIG